MSRRVLQVVLNAAEKLVHKAMPSQEAKVTVEKAAEILSSAFDGQYDGPEADLQSSVQRAADNDGRIDTQHLPLILTRLPVHLKVYHCYSPELPILPAHHHQIHWE